MTILKEVLFGDGEGLYHVDFNNLQRFAQTLISDGVLAMACPGAGAGVNMMTEHLYALGNSGAPFENLPGTLTPNFVGGLVAQRPLNVFPDGNDPTVLLYMLETGEATVARPAAVTTRAGTSSRFNWHEPRAPPRPATSRTPPHAPSPARR